MQPMMSHKTTALPNLKGRRRNHDKFNEEKGLENVKSRKHALSLLKVGKNSLRKIARIKSADKCTLSRIIRMFRKQLSGSLKKVLRPATYRRYINNVDC